MQRKFRFNKKKKLFGTFPMASSHLHGCRRRVNIFRRLECRSSEIRSSEIYIYARNSPPSLLLQRDYHSLAYISWDKWDKRPPNFTTCFMLATPSTGIFAHLLTLSFYSNSTIFFDLLHQNWVRTSYVVVMTDRQGIWKLFVRSVKHATH